MSIAALLRAAEFLERRERGEYFPAKNLPWLCFRSQFPRQHGRPSHDIFYPKSQLIPKNSHPKP